jgi:sulfite dehydrogenase (quinone) subunit SoeC
MIVFTALAGSAQGLLLALCVVEAAAGVGLLAAPGSAFFLAGAAVVLVLALAGLGAATFHLGRPLRAWRAAAMWRTSWLSREVIVLPAFIGCVALWGLAHLLGAGTLGIGLAACALALALYVCTGMIYAAVLVIREWATPLTPLAFALIGIASGALLAAAVAGFTAPRLTDVLVPAAIGATLVATALRAATMWRNRRLAPRTTLQSAIGIRHPAIRQTAQGSMGGSFNTREFFHGRSAAFVTGARWSAALLGCATPVLLGARAGPAGLAALFLVQLAGIGAERWLFFADGRHPQNLYYQSIS